MMKMTTPSLRHVFLLVLLAFAPLLFAATPNIQQLALLGLHSIQAQGQFNAVATDASGNIFLLLNQNDGVRLLKTDHAGNLLNQTQLGAQGDIGLGLALTPQGGLYITGTSTSTALTGTSSSAFPSRTDTSTNSFVAKFDTNLSLQFLTFLGSGRISAVAIAATSDAVFVTGSIFSPTLPVTPGAVIQQPAYDSLQNGFVEKFNASGSSLLYATYLSGATGDTFPASIAADASDDAYIGGYTTASGYPTLAALIPEKLGSTTGFLTKLTPAGDGLLFSTFIPGGGVTSVSYDTVLNQLLVSGGIALGQFPVATVPMPLVATTYQTLLRLPPDGSSLFSSVLLAPGLSSAATPAPNGSTWATGPLTGPLLALPALSSLGNSFAVRVTSQNLIDQTARFGGLPSRNAGYESAPAALNALTVDPTGSILLAGSVSPTASASLLSSATYDLPVYNAPTSALPSTLHDAVSLTQPCNGSLCSGSAAYLAALTPDTSAPSLALSADDAPNLTLRNLGSSPATNLQISTPNFTSTTTCATTLLPGAACAIELTGSGPGSITVQAANAAAQSAQIPALSSTLVTNKVVVSNNELDFGIQASDSLPTQQTLTVTNLTQQTQSFTSGPDNGAARPLGYGFNEAASDCALAPDGTSRLLPAGASCHITVAFTASSSASNDGFLQGEWLIAQTDILLTGYTEAASLAVSSAEIDFGMEYIGGIRLPRYLYLSNNSTIPISHTAVTLPASSPFTITDLCPNTLAPHSICQMRLTYLSPQQTSTDSTLLTLDQGLQVLVTGSTLPQPSATGTSANPFLSVSPTTRAFTTTNPVTATSSTTQTVTVSNTGLLAFPLTLSLSGDFTDVTNCPSSLAANSSCGVVLSFAPSQPGVRQGLLAVTAGTNSSPVYVSLSGTGTAILNAPNGTLDFGSVIVGQPTVLWYKITQSFTSLTASTSAPDFTAILVEDTGYGHGQPPSSSFTSDTTGSCINCWLGVQFKPSAVGSANAFLTLTSSGNPFSLALTGNGLPLTGLILTPANPDFGDVPLHSTGSPLLFTLTNLTGQTAPISLSPPQLTGDFIFTPNLTGGTSCIGTLAPNASCFLAVAFTPAALGNRTGLLTLQTTAGTASTALSGNATPDPGIALSPNALTFNNVPGTPATQQTITLTNTSGTTQQIGQPASSSAAFSSASSCSTLSPSATCTFTVTFTPTTAPVPATLQFTATATINSSPINVTYTVPLTGAYTVEDSGLEILPAAINYGPNPTSTLGGTRQFTILNLTSKALALNIAFPRQFLLSGPPCAGLAPNATCTFNATFLPLTNGDITGSLFATATPSDGSATLNALGYLEGYGTGSGTLQISGNIIPGGPLNFGQVPSGQSSSQVIYLTNFGAPSDPPVTIRRITSEWPFLSTSTCGQTLASQQTCTITVTYSPLNQVAPGTSAPPSSTDLGTLVIESDANSSPDIIDLAGSSSSTTVSSPDNTAALRSFVASQSSLTFAPTPVGDPAPPQIVTLSNTGTVTLHISSALSTPDFLIDNHCSTLLPGSECTLTVTFAPQTSGDRIGAVEISSDASTSLEFISLLGTATPSVLQISPSSLDFGTVLLGSSSALSLQLTNTSAAPITFTGISATSGYTTGGSCPTPGNSLPAQTSCSVQITFSPTQNGAEPGTVSIASSASILPLTVGLNGSGASSSLQVNPAALDFGSIALGSSARLTVAISNPGTAPLTALTLTAAGDFAVTAPCASTTLSPGQTCTATVTFTPVLLGQRSSTLAVTSSDRNSPQLLPLTGNGIQSNSFLLTVDGASISRASTHSGQPATYSLGLTPENGFNGTVALTCSPIQAAPEAICSISPSTLTLNAAPQNAVATINTVSGVKLAAITHRSNLWLCLLLSPSLLLLSRPSSHRLPSSLLWTLLIFAALLTTNGCGSGGDPALRYTPPGSFQYQVTANSTSGVQITRSVTLNLTVTPH